MVFLPSKVAEISRNTNSSAPNSAYCFAKITGSPASIKLTKLTPFTVRPFLISKQGIILFVNIRIAFRFYFLAVCKLLTAKNTWLIIKYILFQLF